MEYTEDMLLSTNESSEDVIVRVLAHTEHEVKSLRQILDKDYGKQITLQALYRTLKTLTENGVLVKKGKLFTVSSEWAKNLARYFHRNNEIGLAEGEEISYAFKSLSSLDSYWKHIIMQLDQELGDSPIFFYNDHVIWLHLEDRKESQRNYLHSFDEGHKYAGFVVGGDTALDKSFKKSFSRKYLQIDIRRINSIKYNSMTVKGDYVVAVRFKKQTTDFIDRLYRSNIHLKEFEDTLKQSLEGKLPIKLTIEKNSRKAEKLRATLSKNFFIPKEIKRAH